MTRAFAELYGTDDAFASVEFSGRTDTAIFRECARAHRVDETTLDQEQARFMAAYIPHLAQSLHEVAGRLMPGVPELLAELDRRPDVDQALGTGNFRTGGELKLRHYDIDRYFPGTPGGFGEDSERRAEVIGLAIRRLSNGTPHSRVVVIGDTPHDVTAGAANGAYCIGVATGRDSVGTLLAAGAPVAVDDLSDTASILSLIAG
jgi:phosphoglycolate phosphatase-like HAD superfamily hydrolase